MFEKAHLDWLRARAMKIPSGASSIGTTTCLASRDDECLKRPATVGYDADATARATDAVKALLRDVFRLGPAR